MPVPASAFPFSGSHSSKSRIKAFKEQDWLNGKLFFITFPSFFNLIKPLNPVLDTRNTLREKKDQKEKGQKKCVFEQFYMF